MSEVNGRKNICLFLVTVYVKSWLESSSAIGAPLNDLMFLKKLKKYENINQGISSIALKKFCNHLWYLNEESSILAIFDKNVNIASKKRIIENLKRENLHTERKCNVQPNEVPFLLAPEEELKVSALCGGRNGLYLEGSIYGIPCLMLVDTGANLTFVRRDLAHKLKENFIYTATNISLKTATGEKAEIHGKLDATIECGSRKFQHRIYVADIIYPCILGLDFLQQFNFPVNLEKNKIRSGGEEIHLFSASAEHSKLCSVFAKEKTIIPLRSECLI
ncbi:hypothetical protein AVEN_188276-1 [Araneus ventricosus]|uniref:Peptidase A2 domain-containing protein n=1 Tax=Araneus ventricosus TaxID=182803 RepID=A0A4Y2S702_ARAVE|nr:hypothetical protein AVEN_188276-1 [Araneus ventricosus]